MSDDVRAERLKKLQLLRDAGVDPYPAHSGRTVSAADFLKGFESLVSSGKAETLAGRVMSIRGQGGIIFADVFDGTGRVQFVVEKTEVGDKAFELFEAAVDQGDFIEATGAAYLTKRGQQSLKASAWTMLAKSLAPLPTEWFGLKDPELKLRERYVDMVLDQGLRDMVVRRARFWSAIREFLLARGFMEVETPVLETSPGGADARPFETHHNALDIDLSLRISLELWLKRLLIAGFPKVFEIGRVFRNEGQSREHLQDYTMLETYEAFSDIKKGKEFVQALYRHIAKEVYGTSVFEIHGHKVDFAAEWPEVDFCEVMKKEYGIDPLALGAAEAREIDEKWKALRKTIAGPAFLVGTPAYLTPLAKRRSDNPQLVERIQVLIAGSEVGNGYGELNDPQDQRKRFEEQQALREAGDDEAQRLDEEFVKALEYGMPPAFGFGVSERLFAFLENRSVHEAQIFTLLRPKNK